MPNRPERIPGPKRKQLSAAKRGYDATHRKLRQTLLAKYPICQVCLKAWSTEAHHKFYPAATIEDYIAVCHPCHDQITKGTAK